MKYFITIALLTMSAYSHANVERRLLCDQANTIVVLVDSGVFRVSGEFKTELEQDSSGLSYTLYSRDNSTGGRFFESVEFSDETMTSAIFTTGLIPPYQGVDEDSVETTNLSESYCK